MVNGKEIKSITHMFIDQGSESEESSEDESYENSEEEHISEFYEFETSSDDEDY